MKKKSIFLDFDNFRDLEAGKQAKHMHMHMICLSEILGISEIVKRKKIDYFQISSLNLTQAQFTLGANIDQVQKR